MARDTPQPDGWCPLKAGLEGKLQAELNVARFSGTRNLSHIRVTYVGFKYRGKLGKIEGIEKLGSELQIKTFIELESLHHR